MKRVAQDFLITLFLISMRPGLLVVGFASNALSLRLVTWKLGIPDSEIAIRQYVEDSIHPGMTREEAHAVLAKVAPVRYVFFQQWRPADAFVCDQVDLFLTPFPPFPWTWDICYSSDYRVLRLIAHTS